MGVQGTAKQFWDGFTFSDYAGLTAEQWAALYAENCISASTHGPFPQTLFLGLSVSSFSCSVGWNEQVGEVTVNLVQDNCTNNEGKVYWDDELVVRVHVGADPGFIGESLDIIGSPVYFRVGNFEFSGLIQSWDKNKSATGGNPTYTVKLIDPRQILAGTQLILGEYAGGIGGTGFSGITGPYNLFNVYGYMESRGSTCASTYLDTLTAGNPYADTSDYLGGNSGPDGAMFGSAAGGFGGAGANNNGMPWSNILFGFNMLANLAPKTSNVWSPYGRILFKATNSAFGYGLVSGDILDVLGPFSSLGSSRWLSEYFVDLSELPTPPSYWRINGSNVSLMDAISQLLEDAGYDYYVELILVRGVSSIIAPSGIAKLIKIRTVRRLSQPSLGQITSFLGDSTGAIATKEGVELRNEPTTSFLIGGKKNVYYQIESEDVDGDNAEGSYYDDDTIIPYFGTDSNLNVIVPTKVDDGDGTLRWHFVADGTFLDNTLQVIDISSTLGDYNVDIGELELQAAQAGYDAWISFVDAMKTDTGLLVQSVNAGGLWNWDLLRNVVADANAKIGMLAGRDLIAQLQRNAFVGVANDDVGAKTQEDLQTLYNWVHRYATEFYGVKYQVRVPYTCVRLDSESGQILTSEVPTQTGWTDQTYILGLVNGSALHTYMTDEDGRTNAMLRFDSSTSIDVSELDPDDYGISGTSLFIRCEVDDVYVYTNRTLMTSPRAVLTLPGMVRTVQNQGQPVRGVDLNYKVIDLLFPAADQAKAKQFIDAMLKDIGNKEGFTPIDYPMTLPDAAGFGIESRVLTYGPWVTMGPAGTVRVDHDDGLVPWNYGGMTTLNLAGMSKANNGITYMQVGEKGTLTLAGYPTVPLGAELQSFNDGFFGVGVHLIENRTLTSSGGIYTTTIGGWSGLYGPNITDITVDVSDSAIQTTYNMRTYTSKFGRFTRDNAEVLKRIGQHRLRLQRNLSLRALDIRTRQVRTLLKQRFKAQLNAGKVLNHNNSPHELLVGSLKQLSNNEKRTLISTLEMKEITTQYDNFDQKAFMGLEGLIRPISMDGDGGLPQYAKFYLGCNLTTPSGAQPPVYKEVGLTNKIYDDEITQNYLNPFSNPDSFVRSQVSNKIAGGDIYLGHDMDLLGAGTTPPVGTDGTGINMRMVGFSDSDGANYSEDYRAFALRGPLLLQSWGYDLNGRPIPNENDDETDASGGTFVNTGLSTNFFSEWLRKPHTWPVAPVDLRFDRSRGVWVAPPAYRLVYATLVEDLCAGSSAKALVNQATTGTILEDDDGNATAGYIQVTDSTNLSISSGKSIIAYYNPATCTYTPLEGPSLRVFNWGCQGTGASVVGYIDELIFGTGLIAKYTDTCNQVVVESNIRAGCSTGVLYKFENLVFASGFGCSYNAATCTLSISTSGGAGSGVKIENATGCQPDGSDPGGATFQTISIGDGLNAIIDPSDSTKSRIDLSMDVHGITGVSRIALGNGLTAEASGECGVIISGNASGVRVSNTTGCQPAGADPGGAVFHTISIGDGLNAIVDPVDSTISRVDLSMDIHGVTGVSRLSLGQCLQIVASGDCGATISLNPLGDDTTHRVWYVSDVECSGSSIVVTKKYIDIAECGLIAGSGE